MKSKNSVLLCSLLLILQAVAAQAEGIVLVKSYASEQPALWKAVAFVSAKQFPVSITVKTATGRDVVITKDKVGVIIEKPDFSTLTLTDQSDFDNFANQRKEFETKAAMYPAAAAYLKAIVAEFETIQGQASAGQVIVSGKWMGKSEYQTKMQAGSWASGGGSSTLTVNGKTYTGVRVTSAKDGRVGFVHDGGSGGVQVADLNESQMAMLKAAAPSLFGAHAVISPTVTRADTGSASSESIKRKLIGVWELKSETKQLIFQFTEDALNVDNESNFSKSKWELKGDKLIVTFLSGKMKSDGSSMTPPDGKPTLVIESIDESIIMLRDSETNKLNIFKRISSVPK